MTFAIYPQTLSSKKVSEETEGNRITKLHPDNGLCKTEKERKRLSKQLQHSKHRWLPN